jgi:hypothetical protein
LHSETSAPVARKPSAMVMTLGWIVASYVPKRRTRMMDPNPNVP